MAYHILEEWEKFWPELIDGKFYYKNIQLKIIKYFNWIIDFFAFYNENEFIFELIKLEMFK